MKIRCSDRANGFVMFEVKAGNTFVEMRLGRKYFAVTDSSDQELIELVEKKGGGILLSSVEARKLGRALLKKADELDACCA